MEVPIHDLTSVQKLLRRVVDAISDEIRRISREFGELRSELGRVSDEVEKLKSKLGEVEKLFEKPIPVNVVNWNFIAPLENLYIALTVIASQYGAYPLVRRLIRVAPIEIALWLDVDEEVVLELELPKGMCCVQRYGWEYSDDPKYLYRKLWVDEPFFLVFDQYMGFAPREFLFDPYFVKRKKVVFDIKNDSDMSNYWYLACRTIQVNVKLWDDVLSRILFEPWNVIVEAEAVSERVKKVVRELAKEIVMGGSESVREEEVREGKKVIIKGVWGYVGDKLKKRAIPPKGK